VVTNQELGNQELGNQELGNTRQPGTRQLGTTFAPAGSKYLFSSLQIFLHSGKFQKQNDTEYKKSSSREVLEREKKRSGERREYLFFK